MKVGEKMGLPKDAKSLAAENWFGYGRWDAPYWFVGMEPGGTDDDANYDSWMELGGYELINCRRHHLHPLNSMHTKWFVGERPPTQTTWRRLIQLLLAFKDRESGLEAARFYQRDHLGTSDDE